MRIKSFCFLFIILGHLYSCAPSRIIKPLNKGENAISVNAGGPLIGFAGTTIPVPFSAVTYGHGLSDKSTAFGSIHLTALFFGNFQTEIGLVRELNKYDSINKFIPGISITPMANILVDKWKGNFKFWPQIDVNTYWELNHGKHFIYLGMSNWFELANKKAHNEIQQNHWIFNPHIGISGQKEKWNNNLEIKFLAPNYENKNIVVDYKTPFNKGAIGIYYSITRKF